jgi:hypothetical protein
MGDDEPIQGYWQFLSGAAMGPFKAIGSFSQEQQWADSRLSAVSLMGNNGPTQCYRQLSS